MIPVAERTPLVEALLRIIEIQRVMLSDQERRITELENEVARLKKNSSTSSKPPSSDITKPQEEQRQPGKRKR